MSTRITVTLDTQSQAVMDQEMSLGAPSQSAVIRKALSLLGQQQLEAVYEQVDLLWRDTEDAQFWDTASGDGVYQ